jgi:hypothetical protein
MRKGKNKIKYIAIIGDDSVVPFYRIVVFNIEHTLNERNYQNNLDARHSSPTLLDIDRQLGSPKGYWMSDVPYGTYDRMRNPSKAAKLDVGLGRIFSDEPLELINLIDAFEMPLKLYKNTSRTFVMVSMDRIPGEPREYFNARTEKLYIPILSQYYSSGIVPEGRRPSVAVGAGHVYDPGAYWVSGNNLPDWDRDDLQVVKQIADLLIFQTHGTHLDLGDGDSIDQIFARDIGRNPRTSRIKLFITHGCHSGLSITPTRSNRQPDIVRNTLRLRAALFGTTSFHMTKYHFLSHDYWHSKMQRLFLKTLFSNEPQTLGDIFKVAHNDYYSSANKKNSIDVMVLYTCQFYGLPTQFVGTTVIPR